MESHRDRISGTCRRRRSRSGLQGRISPSAGRWGALTGRRGRNWAAAQRPVMGRETRSNPQKLPISLPPSPPPRDKRMTRAEGRAISRRLRSAVRPWLVLPSSDSDRPCMGAILGLTWDRVDLKAGGSGLIRFEIRANEQRQAKFRSARGCLRRSRRRRRRRRAAM